MEKTSNGVPFTEEIISINGAAFTLFPEPHHTGADLKAAKNWIRDNRDAVSITIADEYDRDEQYKADYFRLTPKHLRWYEIEQDSKLIRSQRKAGTTPQEFVNTYVLPFIQQTKEKYVKQFGDHILTA